MLRQSLIYGVVVTLAVYFIGWSTGMGGSNVPNSVFSVMTGVFAGILFWLMLRWRAKK